MQSVIITEKEAGQRLDKFLLKYFNKAPKSFIYKCLRKKTIKLNRTKAAGNEILKAADEIQVFLSVERITSLQEAADVKKTPIQFQVAYEDENILVVNKPAGLICHEDKNHTRDTLNHQILYYLQNGVSYTKPAICNRLDVNTTGLVIAGKHLQALQNINQAFQNHEMKKEYIAVVCGSIEKGGVLSNTLYKDREKNTVQKRVGSAGKKAVTHYTPLAWGNGLTLVKIVLETGRSHQIRAHMKEIGHPVLGDPKYGLPDINGKYGVKRQLLHAYGLTWNSEKLYPYLYKKTFQAAPPSDFKRFCAAKLGIDAAVLMNKGKD